MSFALTIERGRSILIRAASSYYWDRGRPARNERKARKWIREVSSKGPKRSGFAAFRAERLCLSVKLMKKKAMPVQPVEA
jgi:hypothetical protein